ncbi:sulfotransferase [Pleurocapsa sp. FMAR1]|uniref:sulfotransferase n=1 Tax=Pleurocapsa sp. FMAR1 TaxID=3040204 RepID=UPI0029C66E66|nr:sulfotransferase [Pleurocapsa sp. FMAR1]
MKLATTDKIKNWIFVSGAVRSGTTFTGRVLSLPLEVDYIHEPYNQTHLTYKNTAAHPYVRPSINTKDMQEYHEFTKRLFSYNITLPNYIPENDPLFKQVAKRIFGSRGPFYLRLAKANIFQKAAIIKDPLAFFLTEYLYTHFHVKPVILVKHPISFVASIKRKNWFRAPPRFINKQDLVEDFFAEEPNFLDREWKSPIETSAAYWRVVHKVLYSQNKNYPDWHIIKHEDMSQKPIVVFKKLYRSLELPWSNSIERKIIEMTGVKDSKKVTSGKVHSLRRNSSEIFKASIESLSIEERKAVFEIVQDVASPIYSRESFAID